MMRLVTWTLFALLLVPVLAGCVEPVNDEADDDLPEPTAHERLLGSHPMPAPDAVRMHDWLEAFITEYPVRVTGTPNEEAATLFLVAELEAIGYHVDLHHFGPNVGGTVLPGNLLHAIVATIPGTTQSDQWLAWGGHYDSAPGTIEAAYDNGSGTALAIELARMLADVETERTRAVLLFSGEEQGLLASAAYIDWYNKEATYEIELFIGLDMVGIAYPAPHPLAFFSGAAYGVDFVTLAQDVAWDLLGLPDDHESVTFSATNTRNSDEAVFARNGIATMRLAGMQRAGDYPGYHRADDTLDLIHEVAGGRENFEQGLANTASMAYAMLLALDRSGVPEAAG